MMESIAYLLGKICIRRRLSVYAFPVSGFLLLVFNRELETIHRQKGVCLKTAAPSGMRFQRLQ
jgi:hypothetical protein